MANVTKTTRAGRYGKKIACPRCKFAWTTYHFCWDKTVCIKCKVELAKTDILLFEPKKPTKADKEYDKKFESPVLLIEACGDKRDFYANSLMEKGMWFDMSGTRAVIAFDKGNTATKLKNILFFHDEMAKYTTGTYGNDVTVSIIEDPGLGIMLPKDFKK